MKNTLLIFTVFIFVSVLSFAQTSLIGSWSDYLSFNAVVDLEVHEDHIFGATKSGLVVVDISDNSYQILSKSNALTGTDVTSIGYNVSTNGLLVGYSSGRLDLIVDDQVTAIIDILNKNIGADKRINSILMDSVYAYIATGFGIVKYDMLLREVRDTYIVSTTGSLLNVNEVTIHQNKIYAATDLGIRYANANDPNLGYYGVWSIDSSLNDPLASYDIIKSGNRGLFALMESQVDSIPDVLLMKSGNTSWDIIPNLEGNRIKDFDFDQDRFTISHQGFVSTYDEEWNEMDRIYNYGEGVFVEANKVKIRGESEVFIADNRYSIVYVPKPFSFNVFNPNSPYSNNVENLDVHSNQVVVAAGGRLPNFTNRFSNDGMFERNANLEWSHITKWDHPILDGVFDFMSVAIDKNKPNTFYGGSLGGGLVEFENNIPIAKYDTSNSTLKNAKGTNNTIEVTGMDFDASGNLWVANARNSQCISVKTVSGTYEKEWYGYNFNSIDREKTHDILVDQQNYKWVVLAYGGPGILVFNDNNTIDDTSDDQNTILTKTPGRGGLHDNRIYCLAEDKDGEIWVGTADGIAVFYSPGSIFQEGINYDAQRIILEANGYYEYLLSAQIVTSIAVDDANRKWIGTDGNGLFLMSAEGTTELLHFTEENSPLLSNKITKIKINEETGEVLIATNKGIVSYKSTATGEEAAVGEAYAYPNPVPSNYEGLIGIKGLPSNSPVKITDIAGNLVFETIAEGTQAVWNGRDMNGNKVGTGIYLVMATEVQGNGSMIVKVMISE